MISGVSRVWQIGRVLVDRNRNGGDAQQQNNKGDLPAIDQSGEKAEGRAYGLYEEVACYCQCNDKASDPLARAANFCAESGGSGLTLNTVALW